MERICECGVEEGQLHSFGCRWEYCPFCHSLFAQGCDCAYVFLGLKSRKNPPEYDYLSEDKYKNGLSHEQWLQWQEVCHQRGRIPFIDIPQLCARCGCLWPEMFMVQDKVWEYYTTPELKDKVLCLSCFQTIKQKIDKYNERPTWLPADEEIEAFITAWQEGDKERLMELEPQKFNRHR